MTDTKEKAKEEEKTLAPQTTVASPAHSSLTYSADTHIGMKRGENQDNFGVIEKETYRFYIVADGMGGVKGGALASQLAVEVVTNCLKESEVIGRNDISSAVSFANNAIFEHGLDDSNLAGMGTTFVGLCFIKSTMLIVNVGDSRAYRIRNGEIEQLTEDHTLVNELIKSGAMDPSQAENNPVSHMLTRSLGPAASVEVDCWVAEEPPENGDAFLLCSDGLYNLVSDEEIKDIVIDNEADEAIQKLINLANERGGSDNTTIIIVNAGDSYTYSSPARVEKVPKVDKPSNTEIAEANGLHVEQAKEENVGFTLVDEPYDPDEVKEDREVKPDEKGESTIDDVVEEVNETLDNTVEELSTKEISTVQAQRAVWNQPVFLSIVALLTAASAMISYWSGYNASQNSKYAHQDNYNLKNVKKEATALNIQKSQNPIIENVVSLKKDEKVDESLSADKAEVENTVDEEQVLESSENLIGDKINVVASKDIPEKFEFPEIIRGPQTVDSINLKINDAKEKLRYLQVKSIDYLDLSIVQAKEDLSKLEKERAIVGSKIDIANRKLAVWYGRQKRLETIDEISMANEVSVFSDDVKIAKDQFEQATWSYLKAREEYQYDPQNNSQKRVVDEMLKNREEKLSALESSVVESIDREIVAAQKESLEFSQIRDDLDVRIKEHKTHYDFLDFAKNGESFKKQEKVLELTKDLEILEVHLRRLKPGTVVYTSDLNKSVEKEVEEPLSTSISELRGLKY